MAIATPAASAAPSSPAVAAHASHAAMREHPGAGKPPGNIISWSIVGATPKGPDGRYQFAYNNIKPGTVIKDWVEIFNRSTRAAAFELYGTDAAGTTPGNSLIYLEPSQKPKDIGKWTTVFASTTQPNAAQASYVMPGGTGVIEPFTISVPLNATPGDHTGGLMFQVGVPRVAANGNVVTTYSRIALPIELRVTGPLHSALQVQSMSTSFNDSINPFGTGSATISYSVVNNGNVRMSGTQVLKVSGPFGISSIVTPPHLPTILPGDSIRVTTTIGGLYPAGPFSATATVTPQWPPTSVQANLPLMTASSSASFFAVPWALLVLIVLLAGGGYGTYRYLRWRVRTRAADMAAVVAAARKDAERQMSGKAASAASAAQSTGTTATTGDAPPDSQEAGE
jgi:hypothetical protein